jgi:sporulation protein YlmC with PRC-barrel domain
MMKQAATLFIGGLLLACGSAFADETTDPSYDPNRAEQAPPAPPQLVSAVTGEPQSEAFFAADDELVAVRESLLGKAVVTVDGDEIGVVHDVGYSSAYGEPVAVVAIDAFIGIGEKQIAIPLSQLQSADTYSSSVMTLFTRDAIEAEDAFDEADFTAIE